MQHSVVLITLNDGCGLGKEELKANTKIYVTTYSSYHMKKTSPTEHVEKHSN